MQNQNEFPVILHQSLLSGNFEISTCKGIGNPLIRFKIFLCFFHIFPSAEDKHFLHQTLLFFYYQTLFSILFSELFLQMHKELGKHFCHCIKFDINKSWHNQGTVLSVNVTVTQGPHDDSRSLKLQRCTDQQLI